MARKPEPAILDLCFASANLGQTWCTFSWGSIIHMNPDGTTRTEHFGLFDPVNQPRHLTADQLYPWFLLAQQIAERERNT
jgi:hypothetical protein